MKSSLNQVCLFIFGVAITDYSRLLLFAKLVNNPFAAGVEAFCIFAEEREVILDDPRMLVLCVEDERHDEIDAFSHTRNKLPSGIHSIAQIY